MAPKANNVVTDAVAQEVGNKALERKSRRFSLIWVMPLLALFLSGWLIWNNTLNNGPVIQVTTKSAAGIEEGKTLVKTRSVTVGVVTDVMLAPDYENAILTIQMDKNTDDLLRADTNFWIVKPRIESAGVSGLDTLLSGSYIQLSIGKSSSYATEFTALDEPPVRYNNERGLIVSLISNDPLKLGNGDVVSFRGFNVGAVTETRLDMEKQLIHYQVFIREPYNHLVKPNTKFWISSGLEFNLKATGLELRTESLDNILVGGISFDNFIDDNTSDGDSPVAENTTFTLYSKREEARVASLEGALLYVVMLEDNLHNIAPGSVVTYRGVKVGEVVNAPWFKEPSQVFTSKSLPVLIAVDSTRNNQKEIKGILREMLVSSSLCAFVGSSNLILGSDRIELLNDPDNKCKTSRPVFNIKGTSVKDGLLTFRDYPVIPLISTQSLSAQMDEFMAKMNKFDVEGLSDELKASLKAFSGAMEAFTRSNDAVARTKVISKLADAFENFNKTVKGYGPDTELYRSIDQNLKNIEHLLKDLAPAITEVGQSPRSILFGSPADPVPRAAPKNIKE